MCFVRPFVDSFLHSVIHLRIYSRGQGYSNKQARQSPCPHGMHVLVEETSNKDNKAHSRLNELSGDRCSGEGKGEGSGRGAGFRD